MTTHDYGIEYSISFKRVDHDDSQILEGFECENSTIRDFARYKSAKSKKDVTYIFIDNEKVKDGFFDNPSLAYNYVLNLLLEKHLKNNNLPFDDYLIEIDQRNLKKISINSLEEYLNIELKIRQNLVQSLNIEYYDSKDNLLVQVSDFFSNLYFSYLRFPHEYKQLFNKLKDNNYIKDIYYYPQPKHK